LESREKLRETFGAERGIENFNELREKLRDFFSYITLFPSHVQMETE
jgi:hypothetical protein